MNQPALRIAHPQPGQSGGGRRKPHRAHKLPPLLAHAAALRAAAVRQHLAVQAVTVLVGQAYVDVV